MDAESLVTALVRLQLAASAAILVVLLLRPLALRWCGAGTAYWLWLVVPLAAMAVLLPAREQVVINSDGAGYPHSAAAYRARPGRWRRAGTCGYSASGSACCSRRSLGIRVVDYVVAAGRRRVSHQVHRQHAQAVVRLCDRAGARRRAASPTCTATGFRGALQRRGKGVDPGARRDASRITAYAGQCAGGSCALRQLVQSARASGCRALEG